MVASNSNSNAGGTASSPTEIIIEVIPGESIRLPFETPQGVRFTQDAGNLLVAPVGGGDVHVLQDFLVFGTTESPATLEFANGLTMEIDEITVLIEEYDVSQVTPRAGDDFSAGGGADFQQFNDGGLPDAIGIEDLLPPTALEFARDELEEIIGENEDLPGEPNDEPDDPSGTITVSFSTPNGTAAPFDGGFEDWQPNQNTGDFTESPMQMQVEFTPDTDEELQSIDISGFPDGSRLFVGGTDAGDEVDVSSGSVTVAAVGGVLPNMFVLPPPNSDDDFFLTVEGTYENGGGLQGTANAAALAVIDAVADIPDLGAADPAAFGDENTVIDLPQIFAALQDTDGSETLAVAISGVPAGVTLSDGTNTVVSDGSDIDVSGWDLTVLRVTPVTDDDSDFAITITATSTEGATVADGGELTDANNVATTSIELVVIVDPASGVPTVVVADAAGKEDLGNAADQIASIPEPAAGNIPLSISLTTGEGGTEDGYVILSGYPAGVTFSIGAADGAGWRVTKAELELGTLTINGLPADSDADFSITVTPFSKDGGADAVAGTAGTIDVLIDAVADIPTLTLDGAAANDAISGEEDTAIDLPEIVAGLQDTDGSESLSISISGLPVGATLSDGLNTVIGDGSDVDVTGWDINNVSVTSANNDDSDFVLTVTATATEGAAEAPGSELQDADNTASTSFNIEVRVGDLGPTAVDDGPASISEPVDTHAVFVIDTSRSLSQADLALMEEALKNLATDLFTQNPLGTAITLIDFGTSAEFIGGGDGTFTTLSSVLTALDDLDTRSGGLTDYAEALDLVKTIDFVDGYQKSVYFLSDGVPNTFIGTPYSSTQEGIDAFNDWVAADPDGVDVFAVGISDDAKDSIYLGEIDNTPVDDNFDPAVGEPFLFVDDPADLDGSLVTNNDVVSGNVLTNDSAGNDPLAAVPIISIEYNGTTYDLGSGGGPVTIDGDKLTLDSEFGVFTIDFQTGDYSYIANTDINQPEQEVFSYTITDTDGLTATANLTIDISPSLVYVGDAGDNEITGGAGNDYIVGEGGDDTLTGGAGDDRFTYESAGVDGDDIIKDFGANGDDDVIDLTALFEDLGIDAADRADHVIFNEAGGNTTITVTNAADVEISGFSILVENASLDNADILSGKIVVDES